MQSLVYKEEKENGKRNKEFKAAKVAEIVMKILIIDGCPREGNTWKIVTRAVETIKERYCDSEFEEIKLAKEALPFCTGCSNCFRIGNDNCPHYGIVGKIIEKIKEADGVIVCSSTFNWRETALLKNLMDHLCFMLHRPYFYKTKGLVITSTGGTGGKRSAKSISATLTGIGFNHCYKASFAAYSWNDYHLKESDIKKITKVALEFANDVNSEILHSPALMNIIPYNIMRGMGQHYTLDSEYPTEDGSWWTVSKRRGYAYFPQIKLPLHKKLVGNLFYLFGKKLGGAKKMQVTYKK